MADRQSKGPQRPDERPEAGERDERAASNPELEGRYYPDLKPGEIGFTASPHKDKPQKAAGMAGHTPPASRRHDGAASTVREWRGGIRQHRRTAVQDDRAASGRTASARRARARRERRSRGRATTSGTTSRRRGARSP